jgi:hypothetical protein
MHASFPTVTGQSAMHALPVQLPESRRCLHRPCDYQDMEPEIESRMNEFSEEAQRAIRRWKLYGWVSFMLGVVLFACSAYQMKLDLHHRIDVDVCLLFGVATTSLVFGARNLIGGPKAFMEVVTKKDETFNPKALPILFTSFMIGCILAPLLNDLM